jgi:hypothetical protein
VDLIPVGVIERRMSMKLIVLHSLENLQSRYPKVLMVTGRAATEV